MEQLTLFTEPVNQSSPVPKATYPFGRPKGAKDRKPRGRLTPDRKKTLRSLYASGVSAADASREVGLSPAGALKALREMNVPIRGSGEMIRKHAINEEFFSETGEATAYVLGMLATDGTVDGIRGFTISLKRSDRHHLQKLNDLMGSEYPVYDTEHISPNGTISRMARLSVSSRKMAADLLKHGLHPNKTFTVKPWQGPPDLVRHWIRGCLDGDGCISTPKRLEGAESRWNVQFCGNVHMVQGFADFVARLTGDCKVPYKTKRSAERPIFAVTYCRLATIHNLLHNLYDDATVWLDRKKRLADQILAQPITYPHWDWLTKEHLLRVYDECGHVWERVVERLGITAPTLLAYRKHFGIVTVREDRRDWSWLTADHLLGLFRQLGKWAYVARHLGMVTSELCRQRRRLHLL